MSDDNYTRSDWGYDYILSWISDATRMNRDEYENWRKVQTLQKKDPNFIKRYLMILKSEEKVKDIMAKQQNCKKEEFLGLLNETEKKIISEIVKGTDFNKIYQKVGISSTTFPCCMSDIYRKTKHIIPYGKKLKKTVLMEYLFKECEFADGRSEASPDSEQIEPTVAKPHRRNSVSVEQIQDSGFQRGDDLLSTDNSLPSCHPNFRSADISSKVSSVSPDAEICEDIQRNNEKVSEPELVQPGKDRIIESLEVARDFLHGKYRGFCEKLGDLLIQSTPQNALESSDYSQAKDYDNAIWVLVCALTELKKCNQGE